MTVYKLNPYKRYQTRLSVTDLYPTPKDGTCSCGCGVMLTGRKTRWHSRECSREAVTQFSIVKGDTSIIREVLFDTDAGHCRKCGEFDEHWEADHILPVHKGGGACGMENFQTLCQICHKTKTSEKIK